MRPYHYIRHGTRYHIVDDATGQESPPLPKDSCQWRSAVEAVRRREVEEREQKELEHREKEQKAQTEKEMKKGNGCKTTNHNPRTTRRRTQGV